MCIIVYSPAGVTPPEMSTIRECFYANSDGAGFAISNKEDVYYSKGFMTLATFEEAYNDLAKENDLTKRAFALHFRIATHGKVTAANCHPFPLNAPNKTEGIVDEVFFHNGMFNTIEPSTRNVSDTKHFADTVLSPIADVCDITAPPVSVARMIEELSDGCRLLILGANDAAAMYGTWYNDEKGNYFSNQSYQTNYSYYAPTTLWELKDDKCKSCLYADDCAMFSPYCLTPTLEQYVPKPKAGYSFGGLRGK